MPYFPPAVSINGSAQTPLLGISGFQRHQTRRSAPPAPGPGLAPTGRPLSSRGPGAVPAACPGLPPASFPPAGPRVVHRTEVFSCLWELAQGVLIAAFSNRGNGGDVLVITLMR